MEIVDYELNDSRSVAVFFREVFAELGWQERPSDYMDEPHLLFRIPDGGALLLVKENNRLIATAGIILLNKTDALIKRFYVHQEYRGSGIARRLLGELTIKARSLGINKFVLDVSKNNPRAVRFYEKSDFLPTDVVPQEAGRKAPNPKRIFISIKIYEKNYCF